MKRSTNCDVPSHNGYIYNTIPASEAWEIFQKNEWKGCETLYIAAIAGTLCL